MKYKNGREAKLGDQVTGKDLNGNTIAGKLAIVPPQGHGLIGHIIRDGSKRGELPSVANLSDLLHADDADKPSGKQTPQKPSA